MAALEAVRRALQAESPREVNSGDRQQASVALVLTPAGPTDLSLLLIRRARRVGDPWSGHMALPGGRKDAGDSDLLATAIRETGEETGVDLRGAPLLGQLDDLQPTTPVLPPITVRPYVFGLPSVPTVVPNHEVDAISWVRLSALIQSETRTTIRVGNVHRTVEAYLSHGDVIWGMTHRILKPFLGLVGPSASP